MQDYSWEGQWQGSYAEDNYNEDWGSSPNQYYENQGSPSYYQPNYGGGQQQWNNFGEESDSYWNQDQSPPSFFQDSSPTFYHQNYHEDGTNFENQYSGLESYQPPPPEYTYIYELLEKVIANQNENMI